MSALYQGFEGFKALRESAEFVYTRPYGLCHEGEFYWDVDLPRKKGSVVRIAVDDCGPVRSLLVFTMDGEYLCNAYPLAWCEGIHPVQAEMKAEWESMTPEERKAITDNDK